MAEMSKKKIAAMIATIVTVVTVVCELLVGSALD